MVWSDYPSWRQFGWLYLMASIVAWRSWLFWQAGVSGWEPWAVGAVALLATTALLRRWARYEVTHHAVTITNGYTGREISSISLAEVQEVRLRRGPIASLLGIGTVIVTSAGGQVVKFRGLNEPEMIKEWIEQSATSRALPRRVVRPHRMPVTIQD